MTDFANALSEEYRYELPTMGGGIHTSNSNATILSVLNHAGLDVRSIETADGSSYVDDTRYWGHPGADKDAPTLLGSGDSDLIEASTNSTAGLYILGRSHRHDIFIGTDFADHIYGEQASGPLAGADYSLTWDVVTYSRAGAGVNIRLQSNSALWNPLSSGQLEVYGVNPSEDNDAPDILYGIEQLHLSDHDDTVEFIDPVGRLEHATLADGGLGYDTLDFSSAGTAIELRSTSTSFRRSLDPDDPFDGPEAIDAVELNEGYWVGERLTFTNFEHVIGSDHGDDLDLRKLSPGGALTAAQEADIAAAWSASGSGTANDPASIAADAAARIAAANAVPQNQIEVLIEGGAGDDVIRGTETGHNEIRGGAGNDILYAGEHTSILYGGDGDDILYGGGLESHLYGDGGSNTFNLAHNTFVKDATTVDQARWAGLNLSGGVQQWWMEGGWAYWTPVPMMMSTLPSALGGILSGVLLQANIQAMLTFRYGMSESGQLIIQYGRGRGGQAVIEDYDLDLETGAATGGIVVFKEEIGKSSLAEFRNYIELSIRAGFAGGYTGTDPLVLDLDGDGLDLTRRERGDVHFDLGGEGFARHTAWVGASDALLVRDINGNGRIDDISELFGNATTSGFTELAALDSNADGVIDAGDAGFDTLMIWRDLDQNGESDAGELQTLTEAGIASISLTTSDPDVTDVNGNTIREVAGFTRSDGTTSTIADVLLDNDPTNTRYLGDTSVSAAAAALPALKGFGRVTDLRVAMTDDAALLAQVTAFADLPVGTSWADMRADAEAILYRWAGVDGVTADTMGTDFDTRKLAFLETYFGLELTPRDAAGVPIGNNLAELVESWDAALDKATARLAVQGPLAAQFAGVSYSEGRDRLQAEGPAALADAFSSALTQLPDDLTAAQQAWDALWGPLLQHVTEAMRRADGIDVRHDYIVQGLVTALATTPSALDLAALAAGIGIANLRISDAGATTLSRAGASGSIVYVADGSDQVFNGGTGQDVYVFGAD
ncbi:MAG TPA: hypothetical protein VKP01_03665, partial [Saliniramus sp.]|nr:hypothetical protein [Saliniramus sp.]